MLLHQKFYYIRYNKNNYSIKLNILPIIFQTLFFKYYITLLYMINQNKRNYHSVIFVDIYIFFFLLLSIKLLIPFTFLLLLYY